MFNPFVPFHVEMLDGLLKMNRKFLVSQTYRNNVPAAGEQERTPILLTDYDSEGLAKIHYNAVVNDRYRYIFNLENNNHRSKILEMISSGSKYKVYAAFIEDTKKVERSMNKKYSNQIRDFIKQKTNLHIGSSDAIYPKLELTFGELYITIKTSAQQIRFKLADLEKL